MSFGCSKESPTRVQVTEPNAMQPNSGEPSKKWWCWNGGGLCFPSQRQCAESSSRVENSGPCTSIDSAFCAWRCRQESNGLPDCHESCVEDRESCNEDLRQDGDEMCVEREAYAHPEVFPSHTRPGWWCAKTIGPLGSPTEGVEVSSCEKTRVECQHWGDSASPRAECRKADRPVVCYAIHHKPTNNSGFNCALTLEHCNAMRAFWVAQTGHEVTLGECETWTYN